MASIEELVAELRKLNSEQMNEVARIIQRFSHADVPASPRQPAVPAYVVDEAVQHGWPAELFMELIGSPPDLERAIQPSVENGSEL